MYYDNKENHMYASAHHRGGPVMWAMGPRGGRGGRGHHRGRGGPFGPWGPGGGRGGPRARRGDVRAALLVLLAKEPRNGYGLMQEIESRSEGVWRPSPGSVYPTLQLLEDEGLIEAEVTGGRKRFTLTDAGRPEAETAAADAPWSEFSEETVSSGQDTREAVLGIMNSFLEPRDAPTGRTLREEFGDISRRTRPPDPTTDDCGDPT